MVRMKGAKANWRSGKFDATCAITSKPTRSAKRNVPVRGQPMAVPVSASTSSMLRSSSCIRRTASSMVNRPIRLAMKLGVSRAKTTSLPRRKSVNAETASMAAASVSGVAMISTSRM